ncbi:MAG: ferrous iron transporter B [Vampirovibrio sp.]|nr:ferrous iron transporter B [Vampirovibrio sp.]
MSVYDPPEQSVTESSTPGEASPTAKSSSPVTPDTHHQTAVLAGNPNVGKSVVFNALTGLYANVSNFPGTTVDVPKGHLPDGSPLNDTPGVYGLSNLSEEEQVAEKTIVAADVIVNVVSATCLERDLFLTQQLIDWGKPLILVLNQMDEAEARNLTINSQKLSELLGIPVVSCIATQGNGIDVLKQVLWTARPGHRLADLPDAAEMPALEKDPGQCLKIYGFRRQRVNGIVSQVVEQSLQESAWTKQLSNTVGKALLNPIIGLASTLLVLAALYQVIGVWVAGNLVDFTEGTLMLENVIPFLQGLISSIADKGTFMYTVLAGEFGVLTMSIQYIFGVLFPLVLGFYVFMSLLEDCGYMPRIAVLLDGALNKIGLNGRAVIPLIIGLGCVTMATISTRVLTSQRERTIASTILAITIPCSAQLGVIMGLMAVAGGFKGWLVYIAILFSILAILGTALHKLLPGSSTPLVLDLPPMRLPTLKNVAQKTWVRTLGFLKEASPLFILGSLIVALLQATGLLAWVQVALSPVTEAALHLPGETAQAFVMGMVRRDFGAAGLYFLADGMTAVQMMTALVVITLFVPCIASAAVIWKERGIRETTFVLLGSWLLALTAGIVVSRVLETFPIL